jgi:hypothetical protein
MMVGSAKNIIIDGDKYQLELNMLNKERSD